MAVAVYLREGSVAWIASHGTEEPHGDTTTGRNV